jgi:hypothetical protein
MSDNFSQKIINLIDKGSSIITIAEHFGGLKKFREKISKYPYLNALVDSKLGGSIYFSVHGDKEFKSYKLPFRVLTYDVTSPEDDLYESAVAVEVPEITDRSELTKLMTFISDMSIELGGDWADFNDKGLREKAIWVVPTKLNGIDWTDFNFEKEIREEEIEKIIPKDYIVNLR